MVQKLVCYKTLLSIFIIFSFFLLRYFIDHNTEEDRYFTIDTNRGTIKTAKVFDREETPWYNITVAASEIGRYCHIVLEIDLDVHSYSCHFLTQGTG